VWQLLFQFVPESLVCRSAEKIWARQEPRPTGCAAKFATIWVTALLVLNDSSILTSHTEAGENTSLKIGVLLPPEEAQSASIREGVLLAQEQAQKNQNIKVDMIIRGRAGQWGADADEAARMVTDDSVAGLIAPPDGAASHLVLQVSGRTAVPVVTLCGDSSVSRTGVPWMRRVVPRTVDEAQALFEGISAVLSQKPKRWMAVVPEGRAGRECSRDLRQAASDAHCEFAGTVEVSSTSTNFDVTWQRVMKSHPDGILIWLAPVPAGEFVRNARRGGFTGVLAGPSWLDSAGFVAAAQGSLERFVVPVIARNNASTGLFGAFKSAYRTRWGRDPDPMAGMSYDAAMVLIHLNKPQSQAAPHIFPPDFDEPGVTGELSFDVDGNRKLKLELLKGHGGAFVP
jgi:branched-chain amino acid transport system substrate-binding protein